MKLMWKLVLLNVVCLLLAGMCLSSPEKKRQSQIEVVSSSDVSYGTNNWRRVSGTADLKVIIDGEHAYLDCWKRHRCSSIAPGKYEGDLKGQDVWINFQIPITHKWVHDHYIIRGSW